VAFLYQARNVKLGFDLTAGGKKDYDQPAPGLPWKVGRATKEYSRVPLGQTAATGKKKKVATVRKWPGTGETKWGDLFGHRSYDQRVTANNEGRRGDSSHVHGRGIKKDSKTGWDSVPKEKRRGRKRITWRTTPPRKARKGFLLKVRHTRGE